MLEESDTLLQPLVDEDELDANAMNHTLEPQRPRRHLRRPWLVVTIIVLVVGLIGGGGGLYWWLNRQPPIRYIQAPVTAGNISTTVSATGPINPNAEYNLNFPVAGQINAIDVKVGQQVTQGQTLATIAPSQTNTNTANTTLTAPGNATVESINGAVGEEIGSGGGAISTTGSSGGSGSGGNSGSGNSNQAFMVLVDTSQLNIAALVNEVDVSNVQMGQPVTFTVSAYPSNTFHASVTNINTVGQTVSNIVYYTATLTIDQTSIPPNVHLYPGMTATANITTQQRIGTLLIPAAALTFATTFAAQNARNIQGNGGGGFGGGGFGGGNGFGGTGQQGNTTGSPSGTTGSTTGSLSGTTGSTVGSPSTAQGNQQRVYVLQNGTPVPVTITTGLKSGTQVEVLSGLQEGDEVVIGQIGGNRGNRGGGNNGGAGGGRGSGGGFGGGGFGGGGGGGFGGGGGGGGFGGGGGGFGGGG